MSTNKQMIHVRRTKLRNKMQQAFRNLNKTFNGKFVFVYTSHFVDRMLDRDVSIDNVIKLLTNVSAKVDEVVDYVSKPYEERETRLEITDGKYWIGTTMDYFLSKDNTPILKTRMAYVNEKRLAGKISTKVIYVDKID